MHGWIDFYASAAAAVAAGQIWHGEALALPAAHGLRIDRVSASDDARATVTFTERAGGEDGEGAGSATASASTGARAARPARAARSPRAEKAADHPPIKRLGLRSDEAVAVVVARRQPLIVLGGAHAAELTADGARDADTVLVVPVQATSTLPQPLRRRIAAYAFPNAFFLPAAPEHRFAEGVARLDQAQPLPRALLSAHAGVALTADALDALVEWFVAYSTGRRFEDSLIADYRRERLAELDDAG
jgi:hypothetical protein